MRGLPLNFFIDEAAFSSPSQRKFYFANQESSDGAGEKKKEDRWSTIIEAAKDAIRTQSEITGEELIGAVNNALDVTLTPSEEERIRKLVSPERNKRVVSLPEDVSKEEKTPEILELIDQEWARIQEEKRKEKEKKQEQPLPKRSTPPQKGLIPPFIQPGIPGRGANYMDKSQKEYFIEEFPEIADADHWRAFQETLQLVRSGIEDSIVKDTIAEEYPEVDQDEILKAAKGFMKKGEKDPYVDGRLYVESMIREDDSNESLVAKYVNLSWQELPKFYLKGFKDGMPIAAQRLIKVTSK